MCCVFGACGAESRSIAGNRQLPGGRVACLLLMFTVEADNVVLGRFYLPGVAELYATIEAYLHAHEVVVRDEPVDEIPNETRFVKPLGRIVYVVRRP